ncbi:hypothetical protein [Paraliomyxa miuraensis]|uniref:hypothetical protein n=1 Tax=Paraliomyxa miuraensis TaxID=376150 RepID=UPI002255EC41|nr:hypothetical protein [Paraliomyxa miuraensis]MCX4243761.1 hypothetical protein [Paraliomyxa miuraensis]
MRKISSLALAFAFVMPLAGCPAGDDSGTETMADTGPTPTTADTETPATDTGMTTTADTGMTTTADTGMTTTAGGSGFCALACEAPADCAMGGNEADWACNEGFCEYIGEPPPCDDTTCPAAAGFACADVGGVNICTIPCPNGNECDVLMLECTGEDDAGNAICVSPEPEPCGGAAEGEPCDFGGADQYGVCMDGECTCADDTECTAAGYACNG